MTYVSVIAVKGSFTIFHCITVEFSVTGVGAIAISIWHLEAITILEGIASAKLSLITQPPTFRALDPEEGGDKVFLEKNKQKDIILILCLGLILNEEVSFPRGKQPDRYHSYLTSC